MLFIDDKCVKFFNENYISARFIGEYIGVTEVKHTGRWQLMSETIAVGLRNGSRAYQDMLWEKFGGRGRVLCSNCGHITGALAVELDHNVPLNAGGYDVPSNVRPLCHVCHAKKHSLEKSSEEWSRKIKEGQIRSDKKCGRPRNLPENYKQMLDDFIYCRISRDELAKRMNLATPVRNGNGEKKISDLVHLSEQIWYKEYLDELGIEKVVNKVGHPTQEFYKHGIVGYIVFKSGKTEYMYSELAKAE